MRRPKRPLVLALKLAPLVCALLVLLAFLYAWHLSHQTPPWWGRAQRPAADAPERSATMERGMLNLMDRARTSPGRAAAASMTEADANAWLEHRLPRWLENRGIIPPPELDTVRVAFEPGSIRLGVRLDKDRSDSTPPRYLTIRLAADGDSGVPRIASGAIGRLPLPASLVRSRFEQHIAQLREDLPAQGDAGLSFELGDGDTVRIERLTARDGTLVIHLSSSRPE